MSTTSTWRPPTAWPRSASAPGCRTCAASSSWAARPSSATQPAATELRRSLERLQVNTFDLYQIHTVLTLANLNAPTRPAGAFDDRPGARRRADPLDRHHRPRRELASRLPRGAAPLRLRTRCSSPLTSCSTPTRSTTRRPRRCWPNVGQQVRGDHDHQVGDAKPGQGRTPKTHQTWYRPFTDPACVQQAVNSRSPGCHRPLHSRRCASAPRDAASLPAVTTMTQAEQEALIATASQYEPLFA